MADKTEAGAEPRMTKQEIRALIVRRRNAARDLARMEGRLYLEEPITLTLRQANEIIRSLYVKGSKAAEAFGNALDKYREA